MWYKHKILINIYKRMRTIRQNHLDTFLLKIILIVNILFKKFSLEIKKKII